MRAVHPLEVVSGHLIAQIGDTRALLDTGAPLSFGNGALTLLERPVPLLDTALGVTPEYITGKVGTRVDALLGTDVLGRLYFEVDCAAGTCTFDDQAAAFDGCRVPLVSMLGTPVAMASIGGAEVRMVVDTGAQFGYLRDTYLQGRRSLGPRDDFHPILGDYTTEVFEVPVTLGDTTMNLAFGRMPPGVALMMDLANAEGDFGTDLFHRRRARIALPDWEMVLCTTTR